MTGGEIIRALECCGNQNYSCTDKLCKAKVMGEAVELIKRQQAKIERLEIAFENSQKTSKYWNSKCNELVEEVLTAKSEEIKKFAERCGVMSSIIDGLISFSNSEYRPCIVNDKKAVFHRWHEFCNVVEASPLIGGAPAGQIKYTLGTVEFEDGTIEEVAPPRIKFVDFKVNEIWKTTATRKEGAER